MCLKNFLPLSRDIQEHWIYKDSEYFHVWVEMLFSARYAEEPKTDMHEGIIYTIEYGQFIFGRPSWCKRLGISENRMRGFIKKLIDTNMIKEINKTRKFTVYGIINFDKYNKNRSKIDQQNNQQNDRQIGVDVAGFTHRDNQQNNKHDNQQTTNKENRNIDIYNNSAFLEQIWKAYPNKKGKATAIKKIPKLIKEYSFEEILRTVERYKQYVEHRQATDFPDLKYQNGSTFFNSGYVDYLDENYTPILKTKPKEVSKPKLGIYTEF